MPLSVVRPEYHVWARWGQPEDFAGIAVYIMSTASSYHSGETFLIDGAYSIF